MKDIDNHDTKGIAYFLAIHVLFQFCIIYATPL